MTPPLIVKVAKSICEAAINDENGRPACPWCYDQPECTMWQSFEKEARAAVHAVRQSDRKRK